MLKRFVQRHFPVSYRLLRTSKLYRAVYDYVMEVTF